MNVLFIPVINNFVKWNSLLKSIFQKKSKHRAATCPESGIADSDMWHCSNSLNQAESCKIVNTSACSFHRYQNRPPTPSVSRDIWLSRFHLASWGVSTARRLRAAARRNYKKAFCCQYEAWTGVPLETNHVWLIKDNWPSSLMPSGQRITAQRQCREASTMGSFKSEVYFALNVFLAPIWGMDRDSHRI